MIERSYIFNTGNSSQLIQSCLGWVSERGGTILADSKRTFENTFDSKTLRFSQLEKSYSNKGVYFETVRGAFSLKGERLALLFLNPNEITKVENILASPWAATSIKEIRLIVWNKKWAIDWVKRYDAKLIGDAPKNWDEAIKKADTGMLPEDVSAILEYLAHQAEAYNNRMQWQEQEKLKADLMNRTDRWEKVSPEAVKTKCFDLCMSIEDTNTITSLLQQRLNGKRFIPKTSYRDFQFK